MGHLIAGPLPEAKKRGRGRPPGSKNKPVVRSADPTNSYPALELGPKGKPDRPPKAKGSDTYATETYPLYTGLPVLLAPSLTHPSSKRKPGRPRKPAEGAVPSGGGGSDRFLSLDPEFLRAPPLASPLPESSDDLMIRLKNQVPPKVRADIL